MRLHISTEDGRLIVSHISNGPPMSHVGDGRLLLPAFVKGGSSLSTVRRSTTRRDWRFVKDSALEADETLRVICGWEWRSHNARGQDEGYLCCQIMKKQTESYSAQIAGLLTNESDLANKDHYLENDFNSNYCSDFQDLNKWVLFTFHVVYSETYLVPELLLYAAHQDGGMLSPNEVMTELFAHSSCREEMRPFVSLKEHPLLGYYCLGIHPCFTSMKMREIQQSLWADSGEQLTELGYIKHWMMLISTASPDSILLRSLSKCIA